MSAELTGIVGAQPSRQIAEAEPDIAVYDQTARPIIENLLAPEPYTGMLGTEITANLILDGYYADENLAGEAEQSEGFLDRAKHLGSSALEYVGDKLIPHSHKLATGTLLGAIVVAGGTKASEEVSFDKVSPPSAITQIFDPESADAQTTGSAPGPTDVTATGAALKNECFNAAMVAPTNINYMVLKHRGEKQRQRAQVSGDIGAMPSECIDSYWRDITFKFQFKQGGHKWVNMIRPYSPSGWGDQNAGTFTVYDGARLGNLNSYYYHCTPGPRKTKARGFIVNGVDQAETLKPLQYEATAGPIPVQVAKPC